MLPRNHPGRMQIAFDDHRLVANAGLLLPAILAQHLGLRELVDHSPRPRRGAGAGQHGGQTASKGRGPPAVLLGLPPGPAPRLERGWQRPLSLRRPSVDSG